MANSGRVLTNTLKNSQYYVDWQIARQDIAGNYSDINWQAGIIAGNNQWYSNAMKINSIVINGTTVLSGGVYSNVVGGTHQLASGSIRIYHNNDGNKNIDVSISAWLYSYGNCSGSNSWSLTSIPRYVNITSFEVLKRNETSVKVRFTTDATCDYAWYSKDNGASWHNLPIDNIITGLSPNTSYNFKIRLKRQDSQLTTDSGTYTQSTYDYPHCISSPNFTIENALSLDFYNPLGRTINVEGIGADGSIIFHGSTTGTNLTGFNDSESVVKQYASIPNSKSGSYSVKVTHGSSVRTKTGGSYSVNTSKCIPTFNNYTYKDTNNDIINITGNDQVLIKGKSNLQVTISSANKMTVKNGATPNKYIANIDTLNKSVNYSDSDITFDVGTVLNAGTKRLSVTAYDSRNISYSVNKDIVVYDYNKPVINLDVARLNNFEAQTTLRINGTYDLLVINEESKNAIQSVSYRYREKEGEWTEWVVVNTTVTGNKFTCNDIILSLDNTKAFEIEVKVTDKLDNNVVNGIINVGESIFFISTNKKQCYINGKQVMTGLAQDVNRTDLNNYINEFVAGYGHNLTNAPIDSLNLGHFISIPRHDVEGFTTQLFSPYTTNDLYMRKCNDGVWGKWVLISNSHSNKEQMVGTGVDGKPIYRRSFTGRAVTDGNVELDLSDANIDMITRIDGYTESFYDNAWAIPNGRTDGYSNGVFYTRTPKKLRIHFGAYYDANCRYNLTVEYTKTTD